jgi:phosphonate transport system substrate-binding protein
MRAKIIGSRFRLSSVLWAAILLLVGTIASRADSSNLARSPFRIGFSSSLFTDVNENDATAAVKIWSDLIADERAFPVDPQTAIFKNLDALRQTLREGRVDAVGMDMIEYDALRDEIRFDPLFFTFEDGSPTERYALLAHRDGPVRTPADLEGKRLRIHRNARTSLTPLWLDLVLADHGMGVGTDVAADITWETQLPKVVIPVFFRQSDACITTRRGFNLMRELNPQLGKDLVVIAESPEMVTRMFAFRVDFRSPFREEVIDSVDALDESVAGRQVLNLFQTDELRKGPASLLDTALRMIEAHERLGEGTPLR